MRCGGGSVVYWRWFRRIIVAALLSWPQLQYAQPTPVVLGIPTLRTEAYFTDIATAVRLASGDIAVADPGGNELVLVSGTIGALRVIGREGEGPGEYRAAQMVFSTAGDSLLLFDSRLLRVAVYTPRGTYVRAVSTGAMGGAVSPIGSDGRGRIVFLPFGGGNVTATVPVMGFSVRDRRVDTLARIAGPKVIEAAGGSNKIGQRVFRVLPYSEVDGFALLAGGGHVVVRGRSSTVEWYDGRGARVTSAPFPGTRVALTDSMRRLAGPASIQALLPKSLPAFDDFGIVRSARDRVWIRATQPRRDGHVWYGFAKGETAPRAVMIPRGARLVGAAEPYLLVAQRDEDGLQRLEMHRLP